jgi:hypothetical protein
MQDLIGSTVAVFLGVTVVMAGGAGFLMGQALARGWRPWWQVVTYAVMLLLFERFLAENLFGSTSPILGIVVSYLVILGLSWLGYLITRAHKMVQQYPWLYERNSPISWRKLGG